jgi:hypothetical protein
MRQLYLPAILLFLLGTSSCADNDGSGDVTSGEVFLVSNTDSINAALEADSLYRRELFFDSIVHVRDSLSQFFYIDTEDFADSIYVHKDPWGACCLVAGRMSAFVTVSGEFYLVTNTDGNHNDNFHNIITVNLPGTPYAAALKGERSVPGMHRMAVDGWAFYSGDSAMKVSEVIANHPFKEIEMKLWNNKRFMENAIMLDEDRMALRHCLDLAKSIQLLKTR